MKIRFTNDQGETIELEIYGDFCADLVEVVDAELGQELQDLDRAEKKNNRRNTRRHTPLEKIEGHLFQNTHGRTTLVYNKPEMPKRTFNYEAQFVSQLTDDGVAQLLSCLSERQQYLIRKCFLEGWSYTDLAALEGKDESSIRHAVNRAIARLRKSLL